MLPDLVTLQCFVAAARTLNFRAAASTVHLTPAAFGQRIRQLEDMVGEPLFARTTRKVALTARGLDLVDRANATLRAAEDCVLPSSQAGFHGELTVGTRHELGISWLLPGLRAIAEGEPKLVFHLYFSSGPDILLRVRGREIDCGVTSTRMADPHLDHCKLHEERYVFVAHKDLLRRQPLVKPEHAAVHTLLDVSAELPLFRYWREAAGSVDSMRFARVLRLGTIAAIRSAVLAGHGVAVLPEYFVADELKRGELKIVMPKVRPQSDHFRLVFRAEDPRRPLFTWLGGELCKLPLR